MVKNRINTEGLLLGLIVTLIFISGCISGEEKTPISENVVTTITTSVRQTTSIPHQTTVSSAGEIQEVKIDILQGDFNPNRFTIKKDIPARLIVTGVSIDPKYTTHGFKIKEYNIDENISIGETKVIEFIPDKAGEFVFSCSLYCGIGHVGQAGVMTVVDGEESETWTTDEDPNTLVQEIAINAVQGDFNPNRIQVVKDVPVKLLVTGKNIAPGFDAHGFGIKAFGIKEDVSIGETTVIGFTPDKIGEFTFTCTKWCGIGHYGQAGILRVVEGDSSLKQTTTLTTTSLLKQPDTKEFEMTAFNWGFDPATITVNKGDIVKLTITSIDVTHGFSLRDFKVSKRLEPGKTVNVEFVADKTGRFSYSCNVPCGRGHRSMSGSLIVK